MSASTSPAALASDYALARAVAGILVATTDGAATPAPLFAGVFLGGLGTDWERAPAYPYAVVAPQSADRSRGGVARGVRVRIVAAAADYGKPAAVSGDTTGRLFAVGAWPTLCALVDAACDALQTATATGAPVESIETAYDTDDGAPVQAAELTIAYADPQAFGDAF